MESKIPVSDNLEINLADLVAFIKKYFLRSVIIAFIGGIVGVVYSFTLPVTYQAYTTLLPEYKLAGSGSFFSMALGGNSGGFDGAEKLAPDLYPSILSTVPFGQHLLKQKVVDQDGNAYETFEEYILSDSTKTTSWVKRILSVLSFKKEKATESSPLLTLPDQDIFNLTRKQLSLANMSYSAVSCNVDAKGGLITISSELEDPVIAAQLVEMAKKYLVSYVEDYRSSKLNQNTSFLQERVEEAKKSMRSAEYALNSHRDRHRDSYLNVARIQEQQLQNEFALAQSVYSDLSQRLEQAKIKDKEEKPVFKVLEPTRVPLDKSGPRRKIIGLVGAVLFGVLYAIYVIFFKEKLHLKLL